MKRIVFLLMLLASAATVSAQKNPKELIDSIRGELSKVTTPADSLPMYYDIFDLLSRSRQVLVADTIFQIATRAGDDATRLDMLRMLTAFHTRDDSLRLEYQHIAESMKPSTDQRLTLLFININNSIQAARYPHAYKNFERLKALIQRSREEKGASLFTRLEVVMALCAYFDDYSQRNILKRYLEQAKLMMQRLPESSNAITNMLTTQSAINYIMVGDYEAAVREDLKLLDIMDKMEQEYNDAGRRFRQYNYNRYVCYRRILSNYEVLSLEDVDKYFDLCRQYADLDPSAMKDFNENRRPEIYRLLAHKEYRKAIPLIIAQLRKDQGREVSFTRRKLINALIEASTAVGDDESLHFGLDEYRRINEDRTARHDPEDYLELQFVFESNTLSLDRSKLELERSKTARKLEQASRKSERIVIASGAAVILILFVLILFMMRTSRRMKRLDAIRVKDNAALMEERDTLRRTQNDLLRAGEAARQAARQREDFVNNVSNEIQTPVNAIVEYSRLIVDCIDDDRYAYLERFASVINLNAELLTALVNDVLGVASHDKESFKVERRSVSVKDICSVAVDTIKERLKPGVHIYNEIEGEKDTLLYTDGKRVAQVLMNLLGNAVKFTEEGSVTLSGGLTADKSQYRFVVTDTGIGIPRGKEEEIFERFTKLSKYTQGVGLGLTISRIIARELGGDVVVDTTYEGHGSRFIFTISVD